MGDPIDGLAVQVAPPTPPPAPDLNDLGALQAAPPTTARAAQASPKKAPAGNTGGAGGSWGPDSDATTIGPSQETDRTELKPLKEGQKPRAGYDPLGGIREGIDKITEGIESYNQSGRAEHPVLSRLGDVTREVKELLEGGQAAGKPLGTTSGLETNPVVQAIAMAPELAEWGAGAESKIRAIPGYFKPEIPAATGASLGEGTSAAHLIDQPPVSSPEADIQAHTGEIQRLQSVLDSPNALPEEKEYAAKALQSSIEQRDILQNQNKVLNEAQAIQITPPTKSVVNTTVAPHDFLKAVGANDGGAMDAEQVESYRQMIREGSEVAPPIVEYDETGNVIGGDGRHRAMAHALEGTERMPVQVHRALAPEVPTEEPRYELQAEPERTAPEAQGLHPDVAEKAAAAAQAGEGFTFHPTTGETPTTGFAVEAHTEGQARLDHPATAEDVQKFYEDNKAQFDTHPELHIGGYGNELGVSAVVPEEGRARSLAERLDQKSIWDFANQREISTGGKGETIEFPHYPLEQRMADVTGRENEGGVGNRVTQSARPDNAESQRKATPQDVLETLKTKFGTSDDPTGVKSGASFITPEGQFIHLGGTEHHIALSNAGYEENPQATAAPRPFKTPAFMDDTGAIRVRYSLDRAGPTAHISVPAQGVTEEQIPAIRQTIAQAGRNGNVVMERSDITPETKDRLSMTQEFPRPGDTEDYLRRIEAHPEQHAETLRAPLTAAEQDEADYAAQHERTMTLTSEDVQNLYKSAPDYEEPKILPGGKVLKIPDHILTDDATTESTLQHEAAHAIMGSLHGADAYQILSHLHPDAGESGFAAAADFDWRHWGGDAEGHISHEDLAEHMPQVLDILAAGGASDEAYHGIPWAENQGISGDMRMMERLLAAADVPEDDRMTFIEQARENAKNVLTRPGVREIIKKHTGTRAEGLPDSLHMDDDGIRAMTSEVKDKINGNDTESSGINDRDNQEDDARAEGQAPREPVRAEQKRKAVAETISTRMPGGRDATEDPMKHDLVVDSRPIFSNPKLAAKMAAEVKKYPGFKVPEGTSDADTLNAFINHVKENVKLLWNEATPEEQQNNAQWYTGANKIAKEQAQAHDVEPRQAAAVIAAMSPQKDWDMNASLGERTLSIWDNQQKTKTTPEMWTKGKQLASMPTNKALGVLLPKLKGKTLGELKPDYQALWIRLYDEAHNARDFNKINPDGTQGPQRFNSLGLPEKVAWGGLREAGKAVSILHDGSVDNIAQTMGGSHKIRNFYNNIIEPDSPRNDVTIDTHAVAGGLLRPLGGKNPEVKKNFGGIMHKGSGIKGTYALYADAYRQAAKELDIPFARMVQSVTWEKARELFPSDIKTKVNQDEVDNIWKDFENGQITREEAQQSILGAARRHRDALAEGRGDAFDQGELFESGLSGDASEGYGTRGGRGNSASGKVGKGKSKGIDALSFIDMMKKAVPEREPGEEGASKAGTMALAGAVAGAGAIAAMSGKSDENNGENVTRPAQPQVEAKTVAAPDVHDLIRKASTDYGIPHKLLHEQAAQESRFNQNAVSPKGARGVMQLMPNTARSLGVDANDMAQNVDGGARLMSQLRHRFGSDDKALAAYNWSPDKVQDTIDTWGPKWLDHVPAETRQYVLGIMRKSR